MTRDEHRSECIKAMIEAFRFNLVEAKRCKDTRGAMASAFDSLHGIARVVPSEATEEMIYIGELVKADGGGVAKIFASMAKVGKLTNPPEEKP